MRYALSFLQQMATAAIADPELAKEIGRGIGYGSATFMALVFAEVRRMRATKQRAAADREEAAAQQKQAQERQERDRRLDQQALNYRFEDLHRRLDANREATRTELQEVARLVGDRIDGIAQQMTDHALDDERRFGSIEKSVERIVGERTGEAKGHRA